GGVGGRRRGGGARGAGGGPGAGGGGGARAGGAGAGGGAPPVEAAPPVAYDDDPAGSLRLEGQVVDADERPVGGAVVSLSSNPRRLARTEADGAFGFDRLVGRADPVAGVQAAATAAPTTGA